MESTNKDVLILNEKKQIKYIQLEASSFLTDIDFQMMTAEQRGVYCSIIFYLYCNGGEIKINDNIDITMLDSKYSKLKGISGYYKSNGDWELLWSQIGHKFQITGNILTHKRVTQELERAILHKKSKSEGGKKGMKKRWAVKDSYNSDITKVSKGKVSKGKVSKDKISKDKIKDKDISKNKERYLDFVYLTTEEFQKLKDKLGETHANSYIERLNNYVGSKGKRYKSHYHTILNWHNRDLEENKSGETNRNNAQTFDSQESKYGQTISG